MQDMYKKITNANWTAMSLEQNGHYKHALMTWKDLNIYTDRVVQTLNEETINLTLSNDEKILLDELNKLRAEIESNFIGSSKAMEKLIQQQNQREIELEKEREREREREREFVESQQIQQSQQQPHVPTLRSNIPHTMNTRKPGSKMMKSLRPGGVVSYSSTSSIPSPSNSHSNTHTHSHSNTNTNTKNSAQTAANIIWAPSSSINVNNTNNTSTTSLPSIEDLTINEFSDFSGPGSAITNKKTISSSDRAKAALKASAAVKYPRRVRGGVKDMRYETSSASPSPSRNLIKSDKQDKQEKIDKQDKQNKKIDVEVGVLDDKKEAVVENDNTNNNDNIEESEEDADEKLLSKIKGVDLKFAKNILIESNRDQDKVYWDDIAGLEQAKESLMETVVYPFLRPDLFIGLREPVSGMLLFGPPGTGKTMLARAAATESNSTFFSIQSSSLTSKWYGESEKLVRALFQVAKAKAPSIIFVDEIDSLLGKRSGDGDDDTSRRLKNEFLVQWSDLSKAAAGRIDDDNEPPARVLVLAATNLPWAVDEAARRRFVRRQYIPLPEPETRLAHFKKLLNNTKNSLSDEDMKELVELTEGYSGSDITSLAKDAAIWPIRELGSKMLALKEIEIRPMSLDDFKHSMKNIRPSVNREGLAKFEEWAKEFGSSGA